MLRVRMSATGSTALEARIDELSDGTGDRSGKTSNEASWANGFDHWARATGKSENPPSRPLRPAKGGKLGYVTHQIRRRNDPVPQSWGRSYARADGRR